MRQNDKLPSGRSGEGVILCSVVVLVAVKAGILQGTQIVARPLEAEHASREIALVWRKNSPRAEEFRLLASELAAR